MRLSDPSNPENLANAFGHTVDTNITMAISSISSASVGDITSVAGASAFQQAKVAANVQTSVAAKVEQSARTQGAAVLQLLQASTLPSSSSKGLDVRG
jgi:hypothetical protein